MIFQIFIKDKKRDTLFLSFSKNFLELILESECFKIFFLRKWVHFGTFFLDGLKNVLDDLSSGGGLGPWTSNAYFGFLCRKSISYLDNTSKRMSWNLEIFWRRIFCGQQVIQRYKKQASASEKASRNSMNKKIKKIKETKKRGSLFLKNSTFFYS